MRTITVHTHTKAKKREINARKNSKNAFDVYVTAAAEKGKANYQVIELISNYFQISPNKILIESGHRNKTKVIALLDQV